jgi:4'-phosphopantetheinyl transferase
MELTRSDAQRHDGLCHAEPPRKIPDDLMSSPLRTLPASAPETLLALPATQALEPDTVHLWCFTLQGSPHLIERGRAVLSTEERQRADRFVFDRDRIRFTIAHAVLRHLLSLYCNEPAESLRFNSAAAGKPSLAFTPSLHFNLSHSEDRALLGVSLHHELGVDLEKVRPNIEALSISRHYFFGSERAAIEAATPSERDTLFFRYWVAKEAVLKAQGIGLGFPLDRFRVDFLPDGPTARIETFDPDALEPGWIVRMLPCEPGWLGAVAARGTDWVVKNLPDL